MKKTFLIPLLLIGSLFAFAQSTPLAPSCTKGNCYKFTVKIRGNTKRFYYDITNNTAGKVDLLFFVQDLDGVWWSQGYTNKFASGEEATYDRFNATDNYIIYYRDAGDNKYRFPSKEEVNERFGKKNMDMAITKIINRNEN